MANMARKILERGKVDLEALEDGALEDEIEDEIEEANAVKSSKNEPN